MVSMDGCPTIQIKQNICIIKNHRLILKKIFQNWKEIYILKRTRHKCMKIKGLRKLAENCLRKFINKEFLLMGRKYHNLSILLHAFKVFKFKVLSYD